LGFVQPHLRTSITCVGAEMHLTFINLKKKRKDWRFNTSGMLLRYRRKDKGGDGSGKKTRKKT